MDRLIFRGMQTVHYFLYELKILEYGINMHRPALKLTYRLPGKYWYVML
jgi:hypothetical protein